MGFSWLEHSSVLSPLLAFTSRWVAGVPLWSGVSSVHDPSLFLEMMRRLMPVDLAVTDVRLRLASAISSSEDVELLMVMATEVCGGG